MLFIHVLDPPTKGIDSLGSAKMVKKKKWLHQVLVGKVNFYTLQVRVSLPRESPWTEEPGQLQSMGSQRVGHN